MENKQTAVSYVLNKLQEDFPEQFKDMYDSNQFLIEDIFLKAKQMEKEQITKAYNSAIPFKFGEEYYKETYGK